MPKPRVNGDLCQRPCRGRVPWARRARRWAYIGAVTWTAGCAKPRPAAPIVDDVVLSGADVVDRDELMEGLTTTRTPRFLGLFDGVVYEYEVYSEDLLVKDLARIQRYYVARGYYDARVTAARVVPMDDGRVRVELGVFEGTPVRTSFVDIQGIAEIPIEVGTGVLKAVQLRIGEPFDEKLYDDTKRSILATLRDGGFGLAQVEGRVSVDVARQSAAVTFLVQSGPPTVFGPITIVGLSTIEEERVRSTLRLREGEPFSKSELRDARRAVVRLGVFSRVEIESEPTPAGEGVTAIPIRVLVAEGPHRTLRVSGGAVLDTLRLGAHVTVGWEHRNFLGGLRSFTIETSPGLVFYPTNVTNLQAPSRTLFENRLRTELKQPAFIEGRTTGVIGGEFSVYPILYATSTSDDPVLGYAEVKASAGAERYFLEHVLRGDLRYNWQADFPLDYNALSFGKGPPPEQNDLIDVIVSFPQLVTDVDLRDDPISTHSGAFFRNTLQVAGFVFGGDTSDVRVQPEARFYVPISKRVTLATRATIGFLFPDDYASTLSEAPTDENASLRAQDQQKLLFRAFFSGGPNSNRGYPYRGVGPHGPLGYLSRGGIDCLDPAQADSPTCERPLGGLTLWEASLEVRFPIFEQLGAAVFADASDVTRGVAELRGTAPHLSLGLGLRYVTPVGPVRLDAGYRIPGLQEIGVDDPEDEPAPLFDGGPPMTIYFGLGEAF